MSNINKSTDTWKEELIQVIKDCGESLINNAEKIVNDFKYTRDIDINCHVPYKGDEVATITVMTEYIPAEYIMRKFEL